MQIGDAGHFIVLIILWLVWLGLRATYRSIKARLMSLVKGSSFP